MFEPVRGRPDFPLLESQISTFWKSEQIYAKSLKQRENGPAFIFYEGPPTANGLPHPGHCLTRTIKDLYPRYRTMQGFLCRRKAGWDTHGLPVEVEVCKELGIHSKEEIEAYGIEPFIHRCQESVWRYMKEWESLTERIGFWIDLSDAYGTYQQSYVESVWWALATLFRQGQLYRGHKIVWWWAQGGTALSAGEVGQGYREVADPSVFIALPLTDDQGQATARHLVAWTTTPWTLPSNQFAAVRADLLYSVVFDPLTNMQLVVASVLVDSLQEKLKRTLEPVETFLGATLVGRTYLPPFDTFRPKGLPAMGRRIDGVLEAVAWRVVAGEFVTTDTGTGIVHCAPAFGEVDYGVLLSEQSRFEPDQGPALILCVAPDGRFTEEFSLCSGRFVKECDRDIIRSLKSQGLLVHQEQIVHDYPFCWRAENDALIQYPRTSWFIRTSSLRNEMLANNAKINWIPEHIRDGRFGNFLESNVDWALSRERFWGTPLPLWICQSTGNVEAVASFHELLAKSGVQGTDVWEQAKKTNPHLPDDLKVHKPYIDAITYDSPFEAGARMHRVSEVIDCWFDSGAMPFAQWGWPHRGHADFESQFPADFISEAIDQTRGWFYSLLAISTLLFGDRSRETRGVKAIDEKEPLPHPYRNCMVLGLMLGEDGTKMSKSKRNYREPAEIFDKYGADALRWFFLANQPPWTSIRYSERAIRESIPEFLLRLWNVYSFFVIYARIDDFDPATLLEIPGQLLHADLSRARAWKPVDQRCELDRWLIAELHATTTEVIEHMDRYDHFSAAASLHLMVDAMSNWYVRRSRDRFWGPGKALADSDKLDAYWTLYECLLTVTKLAAPFVPFMTESLWHNLAVTPWKSSSNGPPESVHLCDYPTSNKILIDSDLARRMALVRDISSLGRAARAGEKLKVRQPLARVEVILSDSTDSLWLESHGGLVCEELNVKSFTICNQPDRYIVRTILPELKRLGPKMGKSLPAVRAALGVADTGALCEELERFGRITLSLADGSVVQLDRDDLILRTTAKQGWAAAESPQAVVVIATELTRELLDEGLVREVVHAVQTIRRALELEFTDTIELGFQSSSQDFFRAIETHSKTISSETLALTVVMKGLEEAHHELIDVDGQILEIWVKPVNRSVPKTNGVSFHDGTS